MLRRVFPSFFLLSLALAACSSSRRDFDADTAAPAGGSTLAGGKPPFNRNAACASSVEPTTRAPGSVLIVLDRSFSMNSDAQGGEARFGEPSKWDDAVSSITTLVDSLPEGLELGLEMFPSTIGCNVAASPQVPLGDIKTVRSAVKSALGVGADGDTPTEPALRAAYAVLGATKGSGSRAIILLSDGAPNCGSSTSSVEKAVSDGASMGVQTYVVGVPGSPYSDFSRLAVLGGTRRDPSCLESCEATWADTEKCCHYVTSTSDFKTSLTAALSQIAEKLRTDCVYEVPRPPGKVIDPGQVNVLATIGGAESLVYRSGDPTSDGWSYSDGTSTFVVIHGPLCSKILGDPRSKVEIVVGCPTEVR